MAVVAPSSDPPMLTGRQHSAGRRQDHVVVANSVRGFLVSVGSRWWSVVSSADEDGWALENWSSIDGGLATRRCIGSVKPPGNRVFGRPI